MGTAIRPPFMLYTLRVEAGVMGSPAQPAVFIREEIEAGVVRVHALSLEQARDMAADLVTATYRSAAVAP